MHYQFIVSAAKSLKTSEFEADGIGEIVAAFRDFLRGAGFHHQTIDEYVPDPTREWNYADEPRPDRG